MYPTHKVWRTSESVDTARAAVSVGSAVGYLVTGRTSMESWFASQQEKKVCFYPKNAQLGCGAALS
jgi:hypothetical protein